MTSPRRAVAAALPALALAALTACAPALDWRESRPEASEATLMFPCRPGSVERAIRLAGARLAMRLHTCVAGGATFSLAVADAGAASAAPTLLAAWRGQSVDNVAGRATALPMPAVAGAASSPAPMLDRIEGHLPDGRPVVEHAAFFVKGPRLYQAAIVTTGAPPGPETLDNFFGAIRLR